MLRILLAAIFLVFVLAPQAGADDLPKRCLLEPINGDCKALIENFYYDVGGKKCQPYFYDGCGPVVPFESLEDCRALCETGAELRMTKLRRVEARPFARVELEYPKDWTERPAFTALVNGTEVAARVTGGGSTPEVNAATMEVFLGPDPVRELAITTEVGGRTYRVFSPLHWTLPAMLLLLDHVGEDEALLVPGELRFFAFRSGAPTVRHEGAELPTELVHGEAGGASVWRVSPPWKPGRNTISAEVPGSDGTPLKRDYSFINLADGKLAYRQKAFIPYGVPGSRSGPFYRLETVGDAVALGAEVEQTVDAIDDAGWLTYRQRLVREIVGAAAGDSVLRIYEKAHFLESEKIVREIHMHVRENAGGGKP